MLLRACPPHPRLHRANSGDAPTHNPLLVAALRAAVDSLQAKHPSLLLLHDAHTDDMQPNSECGPYDPHSHYRLVTPAQDAARRYASASPAASPVQSDAYRLSPYQPPPFPPDDARYSQPLSAEPYAWPPAPYVAPPPRYDTALHARPEMYAVPRSMPPQAHYAPVPASPPAPYPWPSASLDLEPAPVSILGPAAADTSRASTSHIYDPPEGAYPTQPSPSDSQDDQASAAPSSPSEQRHPRRGHAKSASKTYSFVSLPGSHTKKRPRRRYDEIERLYQCSFILPNGTQCTKGYGTLNHLNAHIVMQRHGEKRQPSEFKEMRKRWRKMKKEPDADFPLPGRSPEGSRQARPQLAVRIPPHTYAPDHFKPEPYSPAPPSAYMSAPPGLPFASPAPFMEPLRADARPSMYEEAPYEEHARTAYEEHPRSAYDAPRGAYAEHSRGTYDEQPRNAYEEHPRSAYDGPHTPSALHAAGPSGYHLGPPPLSLPGFPPAYPPSPFTRTTYLTPISPTVNRLPPDSTLLTPLPGYVPAESHTPSPPNPADYARRP